ncbi:asparagine synthase-related protein [Oceanihabitans sp. 2_MG-2023]|uniref:asparagine synthase-related protein n=1 Tax=Oceanihabitans sp. 2_MG-2023 TaxID=3062661 RepID=UPI0026E3BF8D|nr:asparagine synthase-related protein [Oceanihabitans sp. 2_MG-2023]MDO6597692.1 asparagine synthase-related protein [Oceanihabitans sp. 2_MG-2023]
MKITTGIIPIQQQFVGTPQELDYEAICVFVATGFFLDTDTYYKGLKVLKPGRNYLLDDEKTKILSEKAYFKWHYTPKERPLKQIVAEFAEIFETVIKEQTAGKKVILPLSGGLDSRTQAVALQHLNIPVQSYSYAFTGGHDETKYSKRIAEVCGFSFQDFKVPNGYLWNVIDALAEINNCYSEFTHPRQMAFKEDYAAMGDVFSLGHWGDVLFDDMAVHDNMNTEEQVSVLLKKIVKKDGLLLAESIWESQGFAGDFITYFKQRITNLLVAINIPNSANAQIRAFKSLYWAPRWTSVNLSVFQSERPITLPYYDARICNFICSVPEKFLAGRQIQIEYIKLRLPALAKITWQAKRPFNLYNYQYNKTPWNLPYRVINKLQRITAATPYVQRNWELQFIGMQNDKALQGWLFQDFKGEEFVNLDIRKQFYTLFKETDGVFYAHSVSMLLTLALFFKQIQPVQIQQKD